VARQAPIGILGPVADELRTPVRLLAQGCFDDTVQLRDNLRYSCDPLHGALSQKSGHWHLLLLKRCPSPGGLAARLQRISAGAVTDDTARATIQPNGLAANTKRLLSLSVG
jgi:hypothetical protein